MDSQIKEFMQCNFMTENFFRDFADSQSKEFMQYNYVTVKTFGGIS